MLVNHWLKIGGSFEQVLKISTCWGIDLNYFPKVRSTPVTYILKGEVAWEPYILTSTHENTFCFFNSLWPWASHLYLCIQWIMGLNFISSDHT